MDSVKDIQLNKRRFAEQRRRNDDIHVYKIKPWKGLNKVNNVLQNV